MKFFLALSLHSKYSDFRQRTLITTALAALVLSGCQSGLQSTPPKWSVLPAVGTTVQLNQPLDIAVGTSRVFIQYGHVTSSRSRIVQYEPWCQFYVARSREELGQPTTIQPDSFEITKVYRRQESVFNFNPIPAEGLKVAGAPILDDEDGGRPERSLTTYFDLVSATQPNVTQLSCARWSDLPPFDYVGLDDMLETLGGVVDLL